MCSCSTTVVRKAVFSVILSLLFAIPSGAAPPAVGGHRCAYISYADGTVEQYSIGADGAFHPLAPASIKVGKYPNGVVPGRSGKYAYVASEEGVQQLKIDQSGRLSYIGLCDSGDEGRPENLVFDHTGKYAYATVSSDRGYVFQYRVANDGKLIPRSKPKVRAGGCPSRLAIHPSQPFLYVANRWDTTVSQYRVKSDGTLSPLSPPTVSVGGSACDIVFSHNKKYVYVTDERSERVCMLRVNENGTLDPVSSCGYSSDHVGCCGQTKIAVAPDDKTLFITNNAGAVYEIKVTHDSGPSLKFGELYGLTRDNKMRSIREIRASAKDEIASRRAGKDEISALNAEIAVVTAGLQRPSYGTYDADGTLYLAGKLGVLRQKIRPDGKPESLAPAVAWQDKAQRPTKGPSATNHGDDRHTIPSARNTISGLTLVER